MIAFAGHPQRSDRVQERAGDSTSRSEESFVFRQDFRGSQPQRRASQRRLRDGIQRTVQDSGWFFFTYTTLKTLELYYYDDALETELKC